jgi:hypothetical protein
MPRILEVKVIDEELWCRIGKAGEFESGISVVTPDEQDQYYKDGFYSARYDAYALPFLQRVKYVFSRRLNIKP